jgi:GTP pyrophosphokinase
MAWLYLLLEIRVSKMRIDILTKSLPENYSDADREQVIRAYQVAENAHKGQKRASGEPYINHCISVASILAELCVPSSVVSAGLLHDTVEDTEITLEDLDREFGGEIARLVDGVTKLTQLPRVSRGDQRPEDQEREEEERQLAERRGGKNPDEEVEKMHRSRRYDLVSETLRKTFLAMGEDVRVVLIKLADRLHNMRTLGYMPEKKRIRIAQETMDIFAPLANRLGIWQIKWELEDLGFRHVNPDRYREITENLAERRSTREREMQSIKNDLLKVLHQAEIKAEISARPKHIYSIFKKMKRKDVPFDMVYDIRAVVNFDDGRTLEIQIRTPEMNQNAEYGIAAHWRYKEGAARDEDYEKRINWLRSLMDWRQDVEDGREFVDSMKSDVFEDRVYIFTPKGDIIDLPVDSTPIDFAYHVHTDIGHRCRGGKINGKLVSLDYKLKTGDKVEILTAKRGGPSRDWLNPNLGLVKTQRARAKIRRWFKQQAREENMAQGKGVLEKELRRLGLADVRIERLASEFEYRNVNDLFVALGTGDLPVARIVKYLTITDKEDEVELPKLKAEVDKPITEGSVNVLGIKGLFTSLARCCNPAPGDEIVGYITRGRGATIHRQDCPNILRISDRERLVRVSWGEPESTYPVPIRIKAYDRDGLMKDVSTLIADEGVNMPTAKVETHRNLAVFDIVLEVHDILQLSRLLDRLENLPNVMEAQRIRPG